MSQESEKSWNVAAILVVLGGLAGLHRLYVGRYGSGAMQACLTVAALRGGVALARLRPDVHFNLFHWLGLLILAGIVIQLLVSLTQDIWLAKGNGWWPLLRLGTPLYLVNLVFKKSVAAPTHAIVPMFMTILLTLFIGMAVYAITLQGSGHEWSLSLAWFVISGLLCGVFWSRDIKAVLLDNTITDAHGNWLG